MAIRTVLEATEQDYMEAFRYHVLNPLARQRKHRKVIEEYLMTKNLDGMHLLVLNNVYNYYRNKVSDIQLASYMYFSKRTDELESYMRLIDSCCVYPIMINAPISIHE